ncbi:MAG: hypothetical protein FWE85_06350 [Clostridiales bacterium]|nr:hypothetical protein [Clostridiales bacterium]
MKFIVAGGFFLIGGVLLLGFHLFTETPDTFLTSCGTIAIILGVILQLVGLVKKD